MSRLSHGPLLLLAALAPGCTCGTGPSPAPVPPPARASAEDAPGDEARDRYLAAVAKARAWLDALEVDPIALRERGIKGKKKLTEQLGGYYRLWQVAEPAERDALLRRIEEVVAITYEARFHDMTEIDDRQFHQDATSYLRTAVLMERLGLDTTLYRARIRAAHRRLDAHLPRRGPHQRAVFHWYYRHFGLEEPFPLGGALGAGHIARRADPAELEDMAVYHLTHEIFVLYEYGERLDAEPFDDEDEAYLRPSLELLTERYIARRDPDLVGELISCMRYLRFVGSPVYRAGLSFLLDSQNPDGSWGDLERVRRRHGPLGLHHIILHTTVVVLDALTVAFHEPWNRDLSGAPAP